MQRQAVCMPQWDMTFPSWLPWLLGAVTIIGPASIDMYLPAFTAIESSLGAPPGGAQFTLAAYFVGLAIGQMTQGTLSDRFGRRNPIIVGTIVYALASIGAALSPSIGWLALFRALSAVGGAAGTVIPRAIVRDLTAGQAAAVMLSQLMLVLGVAPILAPSLGSAVLAVASWRWIFWILAGYALLCSLMVYMLVPETLPRERRIPLRLGSQLARYGAILREPVFLTHAAMGCCASFAFFSYLGGASPVFVRGFQLSPFQFAMIFGLCSIGLIGSTQVNARLLPRYGVSRILHVVARVHFCATATLAIVAFAGVHILSLVFLPLFVAVGCMGYINPNMVAGALTHQAHNAGSASALLGTGQFLLGAVGGLLVGVFTDGTPRGLAMLMLLGSTGLVVVDHFRSRTR
jgi:DHA1 family bicyclomycin/chloramphenicol resistance-like MFS transporter